MRVLMAMIAGAAAALLGAGIWTAVVYYINVEFGWIAWGIGAFVGVAVFAGSGKQGDFSLGVLAVMFALAGILLGKFGAAYFIINAYTSSDEPFVAGIADQVMYERNKNGETWPPIPEYRFEQAETLQEVYPPKIWAEASNHWSSMTDEQRQQMREVPMLANTDYHLVYLADQLVHEYLAAGKAVDWPPRMDIETAFYEEDYPQELWADAVARWEAMSQPEQDQYVADMIAAEKLRMQDVMTLWQAEGTTIAFMSSFSPFDALWAILAILSAYKIASARPEHPPAAPA